VVEVRSRTGRPLEPVKGGKGRGGALRSDRLDREPTWRAAANRSAIATLIFIVVIALLQRNFVVPFVIGIPMFFLYTALGFYTDKYIYERRMKKKAAPKAKA
jgi:hypothetical protein